MFLQYPHPVIEMNRSVGFRNFDMFFRKIDMFFT